MTNDDTAADDAPFVQAYKLPATLDPQIVAGMARAHELRVVKQTAASIVVEGREDDLSAFADRLEQLTRLVPGEGLEPQFQPLTTVAMRGRLGTWHPLRSKQVLLP